MSPASLALLLKALLVIALYAFLSGTLWLIWRDLASPKEAVSRVPHSRLEFTSGPREGETAILGPVNLIGRAADNTLHLEDTTVSAYHARISHQGGQWVLEDLGSRNGTSLNQIKVDQPIVVADGDEIRFGRVKATLHIGQPEGVADKAARKKRDSARHDDNQEN